MAITTETDGYLAPHEKAALERSAARKAARDAANAADKAKKGKATKKVAPAREQKPAKKAKKGADVPEREQAAKAPKAPKEVKETPEEAVANIPAPTVELKTNVAPSVEIATELQTAFDHFNHKLFEGKLEPVIFSNCRLKKTKGYFWPSQWARRSELKGLAHELGLDFARLHGATDKDVMATLVHEMCHQLINQIGKAPKKPYHCKYWSAAMISAGLDPVILNAKLIPTGKATGPNSDHKIMEGGRFDAAADDLLSKGFKFSWASQPVVEPEKKDKKKSKAGGKFKYQAECGNAFWAKSGLNATCQCGCESKFEQLDKPDDGDGEDV